MLEYPQSLYWLWFSLLPYIGSEKGDVILGNLKDPGPLYEKKPEEILRIQTECCAYLEKVMDDSYREKAGFLYEKYIKTNDIKMVDMEDDDYPILLRHIAIKPKVLFYKGNLKICDENAIGVIGSRYATSYGMNNVIFFTQELARAGYCIVSGMARGIDSQAHISALEVGGRTCAVLGCGLDMAYPSENKKLMNEIIEKGVVISEYPPETPPLKQNFPARNRLISGLSKGLLVVEAGRRSGTLITVEFASDQGRDVFAIPGNINNLKYEGTNTLIKEGAALVTTPFDIIHEYENHPCSAKLIRTDAMKNANDQSDERNSDINMESCIIRRLLLKSIERGKSRMDDLAALRPDNIPGIISELLILEADGLIRKMPSGDYIIVKR